MDRLFRRCPCVRPPEIEVRVLDYCHCSLDYLPAEVFNFERTLEELYVDANQIRDLPRELFYCHGLRKLSLSDNELTTIPPAISSLVNLEELDISKNGIVDLPEDVKCCKYLLSVEASVNPLGKLPDGFTQLLNLSELYLNDTFLDFLPGSFGRLTKLKILEVRENHLNTLPKSMSKLVLLQRLDIGNNHFTEMPEVIGSLPSLTELWCDCNQISNIPKGIGGLKQLMFLDASKNRIECLPDEIEGCLSLADLYLSTNLLQQLPDSIGRLSSLTTLKVDDNRLTSLPFTIGGLVSLSELNISANDLEEIPPSIGFLRHLRTLYADENFLYDVPPEVGSCNGITVLSLRSNNLMYVPDEIGRIARLRVLNLSDNKIKFLPYSLMRLKELQALWLAENQTSPLIRLQADIDIDTGQRMLTCYLLPQQHTDDREDLYSDADSFHPSLWEEERQQRQRIHFENVQEEEGNLQRTPTPYPKEMKHRIQHMRNLALKQLGIPNGSVGPVPTQPSTDKSGCQPSPGPSRSQAGTSEPEGGSAGKKPTSPLLQERHHLLKADKQKNIKDKAKMHHHYKLEDSPAKEKSDELNRKPKTPGSPKVKESSNKPLIKSGRGDDDEGGFLTASEQRGSVHLANTKSTITSRGSSTSMHGHAGQSMAQPSASSRGPAPRQPGHNPAVSYADFSKGLHEKSSSHRAGNTQKNIGTGHDSHFQMTSQISYTRPPGRRRGGYDSDTGYRSDFEMYQRGWQRPPTQGRDGYSSDWEVVHRHKRRDGYSSDAEAGRVRYNVFRPMLNQPVHSGSHEREAWGSRQSVTSGAGPKPSLATYTNIPFSSRTTIRNDEMYEQNPKICRANKTGAGSSRSSLHLQTVREVTTSQGKHYEPRSSRDTIQRVERKLSNASQYSASTDGGRQHRQSGMTPYSHAAQPRRTPSLNNSMNSDTNQSVLNTTSNTPSRRNSVEAHSRNSPSHSEKKNSTDDDLWKAQLYKASIKLQKSPSDRMRKLKGPGDPNNQSVLSHPNMIQDGPSSSSLSVSNLHESSRIPHSYQSFGGNMVKSSNSDSRPISHPTSCTTGPTDNISRSTDSGSPYLQSRPTSLPSTVQTSPLLHHKHLTHHHQHQSMSPRSNRAPAIATDISRSIDNLQQGELNTMIYHVGHASDPPHVTPTGSHGEVHSYTTGSGTRLAQDKRLQTSQYDKDVAVFKQAEPASQVSSSTDSGYSPHLYEHTTNVASPVLHQDMHGRPSPSGHDSGLPCSRESTPGWGPESGYTSPSQPDETLLPKPACSASSPQKLQMFHVTVSKNPGLGFSISGGVGSQGNPFHPDDLGIFITKVQEDGPASHMLRPGDKLIEVNGVNFQHIEHNEAVNVLRSCGQSVALVVERH